MTTRSLVILCISTYEKGQEFIRECKRQGCRVLLITAEKLRDADWPRDCIEEMFYLPENLPLADTVQAVSHIARTYRLDRIVALDEYDLETAATLREHLRIPGMGLTTMRYFRDKLAMRMQPLQRHVRVPDFVPMFRYADIQYYLAHVPGPLGAEATTRSVGDRDQEDPCEPRTLAPALSTRRETVNLPAREIYRRGGVSRRLGRV